MARSHGPNRAALEITLKADTSINLPKHAALVALCRHLATQLDEAPDAARVVSAYLSALKDVERVMAGRTPGLQGGEPKGPAGGNSGALGKLQSIAGGKR